MARIYTALILSQALLWINSFNLHNHQGSKRYYLVHFIEKETEAEKSSDQPKVTETASGESESIFFPL